MIYTFVTFRDTTGDEQTFSSAVEAVAAAIDYWRCLHPSDKKKYTTGDSIFAVYSGTEEDPMYTMILDFRDVKHWEEVFGRGDQFDRCVKNSLWKAEMDRVQEGLN